MNDISLNTFIHTIKDLWTGLNTDTVVGTRKLLSQLSQSSLQGDWLNKLNNTEAHTVELYKDPEHGFILLAHTETQGLYRPPHNHGTGWVFYAVLDGEMEVSTYLDCSDLDDSDNSYKLDNNENATLVSRGHYKMQKGDCNVFLPGDIHDTRCISNRIVYFRLTSCDIGLEKCEGRMKEFNVKL